MQHSLSHSIIGLCVQNESFSFDATLSLNESMFFSGDKTAFQIVKEYADKNTPLNWDVFSSEMLRRGQSRVLIDKIKASNPDLSKASAYIDAFKVESLSRNLHSFKSKIDECILGAKNADDLAANVSREIDGVISNASSSQGDISLLSDLMPDYISGQAKIASGERSIGIPTGIRDWDAVMSGLKPTDLVVVAARPSMGKTSFAMSLILNPLECGKKTIFYSLEMPKEQLIHRLISCHSSIPLSNVMHSQLSDRQKSLYEDSLLRIHNNFNLFICDKPALTISEIRRSATIHARKFGVDVIVIDYLQIMSLDDAKYANEADKIGYVTRELKRLAKELNINIILLSQLNRDLEKRDNKRPIKADLRSSGAIEQDADIICFLYRDVVYNENTKEPEKAEVIIDKHRNGKTCTINMRFAEKQTLFTQYN